MTRLRQLTILGIFFAAASQAAPDPVPNPIAVSVSKQAPVVARFDLGSYETCYEKALASFEHGRQHEAVGRRRNCHGDVTAHPKARDRERRDRLDRLVQDDGRGHRPRSGCTLDDNRTS